MTTHVIQLTVPFDPAQPFNIPLQLRSVTNYFDMYSLRIAKYENKEILKIHLTAEEPP